MTTYEQNMGITGFGPVYEGAIVEYTILFTFEDGDTETITGWATKMPDPADLDALIWARIDRGENVKSARFVSNAPAVVRFQKYQKGRHGQAANVICPLMSLPSVRQVALHGPGDEHDNA